MGLDTAIHLTLAIRPTTCSSGRTISSITHRFWCFSSTA